MATYRVRHDKNDVTSRWLGNSLDLKVILDSNFLLIPSQFKIDIFEELTNLLSRRYVPVILSPTYRELLRLAEEGTPKMRGQALMALNFAKKCKLVDVKQGVGETPDDVIVRVAAEWRCPVATNDRALRKRLRAIGVPVIFLRQKKRLEIAGGTC